MGGKQKDETSIIFKTPPWVGLDWLTVGFTVEASQRDKGERVAGDVQDRLGYPAVPPQVGGQEGR